VRLNLHQKLNPGRAGDESHLKTGRKIQKSWSKTEHRAVNISKGIYSTKRFNRFLRILGPALSPALLTTIHRVLPPIHKPAPPTFRPAVDVSADVPAVTSRSGILRPHRRHHRQRPGSNPKRTLFQKTAVYVGVFWWLPLIPSILVPILEPWRPPAPAGGYSFVVLAIGFSLIVIGLEIFVPYKIYARILKWLAITLLAYPITAFLIGQPWGEIFHATFNLHPNLDFGATYIVVGMLGTTISPYLFFWDTSEVVKPKSSRGGYQPTANHDRQQTFFTVA